MAYDNIGAGALDYDPCFYGDSKLLFRGPRKQLQQGYCAVIGGSETFGKFVEEPYPTLLEALSGRNIVNLGCMYAGAEVFSNDLTVLDICRKADVTIIQLTGAQNMSNRFYAVHPRRNDRFLGPTQLMLSICQDLDFTNVHFTGHLISMLQAGPVARFEIIRNELQAEWVARMKKTLTKIGGRIILLWLSDQCLGGAGQPAAPAGDPMLIDRAMIDQLTGENIELVEIVATPDEVAAGHDRMIFEPWEETSARQMLGPIAHQEAARQLKTCLAAA